MEKSFNEACANEGLRLIDLSDSAMKIAVAYAESDNADPEKIPTLYKAMIQAQIEALRR